MFHLIWVGGSYPSWGAQVMLLYLGISEKHIKSTSRVPRILVPDLGRPTKFNSLLGGFKKFKKFKTPGPHSDVSLLGEFKKFKKLKVPSPNSDVSLPGEIKKHKKNQMQRLFSQLVFSRPVTGLLGRPAAFHGVGFLQ